MNREQAKELLPLIQAFAEGKTIEYYSNDNWIELDNIFFIENVQNYRIKPDPRYCSFKNAEECWQEMLKHQPFGWVKGKKTNEYELLKGVSPKNSPFKYTCLFERTVFADGTPFGIKEE